MARTRGDSEENSRKARCPGGLRVLGGGTAGFVAGRGKRLGGGRPPWALYSTVFPTEAFGRCALGACKRSSRSGGGHMERC